MIVLGVVLLILALIVPALHFLFWVAIALLVIGLVLAVAGSTGREVGGRRHWY